MSRASLPRPWTHALGTMALALACAAEATADATSVPSALIPRRALTAGGHDHFQGQLSPDGRELYYAGNPEGTTEIFVQHLGRGFARRLIDENADVSQPRLSPDGRRLLYVSYQQDAGGDACVAEVASPTRRCLPDDGAGVLSAFWFPDGRSVGVLTRASTRATHQLWRVPVQSGRRELLLEQNMSAPALSPDGRWLVYVALDRAREGGLGALRRVSRGLLMRRLDASVPQVVFVPTLPGASGFPAFAPDGRHLYFTQYLNDTNFDGAIDGNDNGVLFRVPFDPDAAVPASPETYQQLTSGRHDCQYPAPSATRLIATCARAGFLQVYSLPLEGVVRADWSRARIDDEIRASRDAWETLLLLQRSIAAEPSPDGRAALYRRLVLQHVALREYESSDYYLGLLARSAGADAHLAGWVAAWQELVDHRREEQRLRHASLSSEFIRAQRSRLGRLDALLASDSASTRRLARLAESEIHLVLGDLAAARRLFDAVDTADETDPSVLHAWASLADGLFAAHGDTERALAVHEALSAHPALDERERLHHARSFVSLLVRGRSPVEELPLLEAARRPVADGSELALLLDLERILARVEAIGERAAEVELVALWEAAPTFERHRQVAMTALGRAAERDWGRLVEALGRRWLDDVPADHPERKYAEAAYAEVMLERAYVELNRGRARSYFLEITRRTPSLEAHVGYIEASLREGEAPEALEAEYRARFAPDEPIARFAQAYVLARGLPEVHEPAQHAEAVARARALLGPAAEAMPRSPEIHHLYAYLAHRHYHRTGDGDAARAAHARYHLALDLAPDSPRIRANLLLELGLLQASLGNHRIALRHFTERDRLPFVAPASELSFRLSRGRSLFHVAAYGEAAAEMDLAMELVDREPSLSRYRPVVLDRDALYHYAAGEHEEAVSLYTELVRVVAEAPRAVRMKARMMQGAAALAAGQPELARASLEEARALLDAEEPFRPQERERRGASHLELDDYRPLVAGLLAQARQASEDLPGAAHALEERRAILRRRFERYGREAYLLESARASQQLAAIAYRLGDLEAARQRVEEGLTDVDAWSRQSGTELDEVGVALVRAAAELHLYGGVRFRFDLRRRLRETYARITRRPHNPRYADERFLFAAYLALLDLPEGRPAGAGADRAASGGP